MKRKYCILSIIISAALLAGCLSACGESGTIGGSSSDENAAAAVTTPDTTADVEAPDVSGATTIALSGQSAAATGTGAEATDGMVTITAGGTYVVTGTMTEGRILVNAPKEEVTLVLQNASVTCSSGSPLYVYKSKTTTIYLPEGTASTLTDGTDYTFSDSYSSAEEEEPNACLYSKSDLIIAGSGSLTVNANYNNGITGKDTLFIQKASVTVTAVNHGINGKDSLTIKDADITVTSGGDALRSTNDSDPTLGYLVITGSALKLTAGEDGIQAETTLTISGGTATVTTAGGAGQSISDDISAKGLKAGTQVTVTGGTFQLNCCDDAIHSNGDVTISGGSFTIATGDDGMHAMIPSPSPAAPLILPAATRVWRVPRCSSPAARSPSSPAMTASMPRAAAIKAALAASASRRMPSAAPGITSSVSPAAWSLSTPPATASIPTVISK